MLLWSLVLPNTVSALELNNIPAILGRQRITGHKVQRFDEALRDQNPIERISVEILQIQQFECVLRCYGKHLKTAVRYGLNQVLRVYLYLQFSGRYLDGDFPNISGAGIDGISG